MNLIIQLKRLKTKCARLKMDNELLKLVELSDKLSLSRYSKTCITEARKNIDPKQSKNYDLQIRERDLLIKSLRSSHKRKMSKLNLPDDMKETIEQLKSQYEAMMKNQTKVYLKEKHETEKYYMNEINRLRSLIEVHREDLAFDKLPNLTIEQFNELNTAPQSNVTLVQFLAMQLYELKHTESLKYKNISDLYAELILSHDKIKKELEVTSQKLKAETELRKTLENSITKLTVPIEIPKIPEPGTDIYEKYDNAQKELKDMTSAYQAALSRGDMLLERLNANNSQMEENALKYKNAQKEIASLKYQLSIANNENAEQQKLIEKRENELQELKKRHNELLMKTLENTKS